MNGTIPGEGPSPILRGNHHNNNNEPRQTNGCSYEQDQFRSLAALALVRRQTLPINIRLDGLPLNRVSFPPLIHPCLFPRLFYLPSGTRFLYFGNVTPNLTDRWNTFAQILQFWSVSVNGSSEKEKLTFRIRRDNGHIVVR